ncbi:MAG TPA: metallophosphoesterase family protein, partial [Polyangiaceae bacterium]|nr:metallophosphoesterase family protein [Polyangiaceae bacterium]
MPAKAVQKLQRTLTVSRSFRIAVVADTHSAPHPNTCALLQEFRPEAILHAGDIGDSSVLDTLGEVAPVLAIRGNIDVTARELPDCLTLDLVCEQTRLLRIFMTHIAVYGPKLRKEVLQQAKVEAAQLVVCGHSHVPFIGRDRGVSVFNPGSVGPRRFQLPIVFGTMQL